MQMKILIEAIVVLILMLTILLGNIYLNFLEPRSKLVISVHVVSIGWLLFLGCVFCRLIILDLPLERMFEKVGNCIGWLSLVASVVFLIIYVYKSIRSGYHPTLLKFPEHRHVIESSSDLILIYEKHSDSFQANKAAYKYLSDIEQVLFKYKEQWLKQSFEQSPQEIILDGVWYQMCMSHIENSKTEILGIAIVFHRIHEEKKLQEKVKEQNFLMEQANKELLQYLGVVDALESETARLNILHEIQWTIVEEIEIIIRHIHQIQEDEPWNQMGFKEQMEDLSTRLRRILTIIRKSVNRLTSDEGKYKGEIR